MNNNLLIVGAGQFGLMAKEIADSMNCYGQIDFLDDNNECAIGKLSDYKKFVTQYSHAMVAIGDPDLRLDWLRKIEEASYNIAILVSPTAYVSPSSQLMKGTIIEPNATVQANTTIASGCILSSGAVVRHNSFVGDGCHVDCNAVVLSNTVVPARTKVPPLTCYVKEDGKKRIDETVGRYCFEDGM